MEKTYAPVSEGSGDSGRPQKKELRIEECVANVCVVNRSVFSPASALSATTRSSDTACTGGRDSSVFSFTSSVPDAYLASLPTSTGINSGCSKNVCGGRRAPAATEASTQLHSSVSPLVALGIPTPPSGGLVTVVEHSSSERSVTNAAVDDNGASASHISKCKRRLQNMNRPAFDLKAVELAQGSFLEEEQVCNAAQCFPLSEITPLLCVGTWKDAANPALLRRLGIKYVLNVARELDPAAEANVIAHNKDLIYESIPMSDCHSQDVAAHLRQAFLFIEKARAAKARVLVHCRRGISRSPAIVVGYLMASEHRTYEDALRFVTEHRACVSLNLAFQERLSEFVPSGEFFHGPPPSPAASLPLAAAGVLPSLTVTSARSDHSAVSSGGPLRAPPHSASSGQLSKMGEDTRLPQPRSTFSASSSNASSRASSAMRQHVSLTGVPTTPSSASRAPHRPRLAMHKHKMVSTASSFANTPTSLATTACPSTANTSVVSVMPVRPDKASWLEEEVASSAAVSTRASTTTNTESAWSERKTPLYAKTRLAMRPIRASERGFSDAFHRRSGSSANAVDDDESGGDDGEGSSRGKDHKATTGNVHEEEEEEVEEPGSPFGVGNRRAFAQFNFSQPSSSSTNVSPSSKKNPRSFSDYENDEDRDGDNSTTLPHPSATAAQRSGGSEAPRGPTKHFWDDEEAEGGSSSEGDGEAADCPEVHFPQPPRRRAPHTSAFEDLADDEGGEEDDSDGVEEPPLGRLGDLQKPRLLALPGRLAQLAQSSTSHTEVRTEMHRSGPSATASTAKGHTTTRSCASAPVRVATSTSADASNTRAVSPAHAEDSGSSLSHGRTTTGTASAFATTPYGTLSSLSDEPTTANTVRVVSHTTSLSG